MPHELNLLKKRIKNSPTPKLKKVKTQTTKEE